MKVTSADRVYIQETHSLYKDCAVAIWQARAQKPISGKEYLSKPLKEIADSFYARCPLCDFYFRFFKDVCLLCPLVSCSPMPKTMWGKWYMAKKESKYIYAECILHSVKHWAFNINIYNDDRVDDFILTAKRTLALQCYDSGINDFNWKREKYHGWLRHKLRIHDGKA
jgi:hypothetical protein